MSGKPEGRGPPGLQNVLVYVSGESFYQGNGNPNPDPGPSGYQAPSAVKQQQQQQQHHQQTQQQLKPQQHQHQTPQEFYNVQQTQNGYQYGVGVRTVQRREDFTVMGGDGIGGNVVFPRCSDAESSCGSVGASDRSDTSSVSVSAYKPPVLDNPASVAVPSGWKRLHTNGMVIYVSPSHTALSSLDQVKAYLQTQGTCKCGLECPLNCDIVFNFDPKVSTRPWGGPTGVGDLTKLCNHKRKQLAMSSNLDNNHLDLRNNDGVKKKKRKVTNYTASVSQLLAQRERDRNKDLQGWTDGTCQGGRDSSPIALHMQQQTSTRVYPPSYTPENHSQQQFYRYNPHSGGCPMPSQQAEMMGGGGENNYPSQSSAYPHQGIGAPPYHQYQFQQREDHHCQQKPHNHQQHQQQMMHQQQQQQHFQQQQQQQHQHFQQAQPSHMMQSNSPRPQIQQNMQHQQVMSQQVQGPHQNYERVMGPSPQFQQYHQQDHKMHMLPQHQHCAGKQMPRESYQRTDIPPQVQQGVVLQTSQGQMMLPQQAMVLQQQQNAGMQPSQNQPMMQVSHSPNLSMVQSPNPSMVQSPNPGMVQSPNPSMVQNSNPSLVQSPNPTLQQTHQQNQVMMQKPLHPNQSQQGVQVQLLNQQMALQNNQQQNLNQVQSNSNSSMCVSPAMLMHHQRPAPPWQTNRNNQIANQNAVINQQPHNQQQSHSQAHNQQQPQSQSQQQQIMQHNMYERVPPLHHHLPNAPVWNDERKKAVSKLQGKPVAHIKNKRSYLSDHHHNVGTNNEQPCPNVDVRRIPQEQNKLPNNQSQTFTNTNIPSFMEDPSGYLAQQTALLNSTISRQTGMNSNGINLICQNNCSSQMNDQHFGQGQVVINLPTSSGSTANNHGVPLPSTVMVPNQQKQNVISRMNQATSTGVNPSNSSIKVYRSNAVSSTGTTGYQNQAQTNQTGLPDSSGVSPDRGRCSQGCGTNMIDNFHSQNQNQQLSNTVTVKFHPEESPVTSSTFMENRHQGQSTPDNRGPIQGGTVSTSNRSPPDNVSRIPPDDPSPGRTSTPSSTQSRRLDASPEPSLFISTSSPFTLASGNTIIYQQQAPSNSQNSRSEVSTPAAQSPKPQQQLQQQQQQQQQKQQNHQQHQQQLPQQQQQQQQQQQHINVMLQDVQMARLPTIVTTMASGHTVSSNTITSVLAGRANTATVTVNNQTTVIPPSTVVTNQQAPQVSVSKTPLEMVQSVVSSIQVPASSAESVLKPATAPSLPTGHILMSSNGQLIVTNSQGQPAILSPQQNIGKISTSMPPMTGVSSIVTSVTGAVTQVIPAVGVTQQVLGQPTVLVNTLPTPLLFQPGVINVDGTMNTVQIPHLAVATGNVIPGQMVDESRVNNSNGAFSPRNQPPLLSPEGSNGKRKANPKKRKVSPQTVASMLHIAAAQQNSPTTGATGMVVQQQQPQQNFSPPMLQALTILPSKTNHFGGTQQLIATGNILQPLNLVQNFPTIQQFIVPAAGLGGMVMATGDGTATLLQDTVQLNVLTPMQGPGGTVFGHTSGQSILAAGPAGMVIRAPANSNQQTNKVQLHTQNTGGNQFIANSPNQFLINSPAFNGQLSPMLANVSPANQQIHSFNSSGGNSQARSNQTQEFIQCGQTLMVPCTIAQNPTSQNTTVVQQNTTIVQQQTTMVSNNQQNIDQNPGPSTSSSSSLSLNQHNFILNNADGKQQNFILTTDQKGQGGFILSPNPDKPGTHIILNADKTQYGGLIISQEKPNQMCGNFIFSNSNVQQTDKTSNNFILSSGNLSEKQNTNRFAKHSVSTQTAANQQVLQVSSTPVPTALVVATSNTFCQTSTGSPPDTTTHSPVDGGTSSQSPGLTAEVPSSSVADDLSSPTSSSDPGRAQPMVHCVSSSNEQDTPENSSTSPALFSPPHNIEITYNRGIGNMKNITMTSFVESSSSSMQTYESERLVKRSNDGEMVRYDYSSLARSRKAAKQVCDSKVRIHTSTLSSSHEEDDEEESEGAGGCPGAGDLVWGAARGFPSWPGKLVGPAPTPGRVWVRWFGGPGTLSEVHPTSLKTLTEGLEAHHRERKKYRKSRKLNSQLENAIQEAMAELDRMSETPQQGAPQPPSPLQVSARKR